MASKARGQHRTAATSQLLEFIQEATDLSRHELLRRMRGARPTTVRINFRDENDQKLLSELDGLAPVEWCQNAYWLNDDPAAFERLNHMANQGKCWLQNASSLIPAIIIDAQPGDRVLDLCAAPGGKAFHIDSRARSQASIVVNDNNRMRLDKMLSVAALQRVTFESSTSIPAEHATSSTLGKFDKILLDAQCTGEGRFNLQLPRSSSNWSVDRVKRTSSLQSRMIQACFDLLEPGGTLVYSTCTLNLFENETAITRALQRRQHVRMAPIDHGLESHLRPYWRPGKTITGRYPYAADMQHARRILPSSQFEGFFVAKLILQADI